MLFSAAWRRTRGTRVIFYCSLCGTVSLSDMKGALQMKCIIILLLRRERCCNMVTTATFFHSEDVINEGIESQVKHRSCKISCEGEITHSDLFFSCIHWGSLYKSFTAAADGVSAQTDCGSIHMVVLWVNLKHTSEIRERERGRKSASAAKNDFVELVISWAANVN